MKRGYLLVALAILEMIPGFQFMACASAAQPQPRPLPEEFAALGTRALDAWISATRTQNGLKRPFDALVALDSIGPAAGPSHLNSSDPQGVSTPTDWAPALVASLAAPVPINPKSSRSRRRSVASLPKTAFRGHDPIFRRRPRVEATA